MKLVNLDKIVLRFGCRMVGGTATEADQCAPLQIANATHMPMPVPGTGMHVVATTCKEYFTPESPMPAVMIRRLHAWQPKEDACLR